MSEAVEESIIESRRQMATIQRITALDPIENADQIEVASILGWKCVVQKGLHEVGDLVVYIEVDSLVPERPEFEFMRRFNFRVKTIRLRGQISQGIVLPLKDVPTLFHDDGFLDGQASIGEVWVYREKFLATGCSTKAYNEDAVGLDVSEALNVRKYERPEPQGTNCRSNVRKGRTSNWPQGIPKTDELRVQGCYKYVQNYLGREFYSAEKLDGQSITCYLDKDDTIGFGVCSRNFDLEPQDDDPFWRSAREGDVESKLRAAFAATGQHYAIQGERVGPGIQGNKLKLAKVEIFVFNVFNLDSGKYLNYEDFKNFCSLFDFRTVPLNSPFVLSQSVADLVTLATVKSQLNKDVWAEGLVFRSTVEGWDSKLGRLSFKAINPEFDLKYNKE